MKQILPLSKIIVMLGIIGFLAACSSTPEVSPIVKKWKYKSMVLNDQELDGKTLGEPTMEFRIDSTFEMEFGGVIEDGSWRVESGVLKTITSKNKDKQELVIETLNDTMMVLSGKESGSNVRVVMVPYMQ